MESAQATQTTHDEPNTLPMRVFEVHYVDGHKEHFSSHFYDATHGPLVFLDRVCDPAAPPDRRYTLWHRRTIAPGQWRQITEITGSTQSATPQ